MKRRKREMSDERLGKKEKEERQLQAPLQFLVLFMSFLHGHIRNEYLASFGGTRNINESGNEVAIFILVLSIQSLVKLTLAKLRQQNLTAIEKKFGR